MIQKAAKKQNLKFKKIRMSLVKRAVTIIINNNALTLIQEVVKNQILEFTEIWMRLAKKPGNYLVKMLKKRVSKLLIVDFKINLR